MKINKTLLSFNKMTQEWHIQLAIVRWFDVCIVISLDTEQSSAIVINYVGRSVCWSHHLGGKIYRLYFIISLPQRAEKRGFDARKFLTIKLKVLMWPSFQIHFNFVRNRIMRNIGNPWNVKKLLPRHLSVLQYTPVTSARAVARGC